mmetsp:Transcript_20706/g.65502  ORF Transcript_20706/g.65502 Transcript_20706/m.65502 type:complete len:480 (+) Transcript_20706:426-1865(+)
MFGPLELVEVKLAHHGVDVLVATPGAIEDHAGLALGQGGAELLEVGEGVGGLERGNDTLELGHELEGVQGLLVAHGVVLAAAHLLEEGVLRADARVVQTGGDRVGLDDLTVVILEEVGEGPVQHAGGAQRQRGGVAVGVDAIARSLHAHEADLLIVDELVEEAHRVGAAAHARHEEVGLAVPLLEALAPRLGADDVVEVANHHGVGVGAGDGAEDVVGGLDVGHPVANGLRGGILEGGSARVHGADLRAQELHAEDVEGLALAVVGTHVDDAVEAEARAHSRGGHAVLAGAGLRDDALLAKALGEEGLAEGVVDLVRAGVVEVLALEVNLDVAAVLGVVLREALGKVEWGLAAHKVLEHARELGLELGVLGDGGELLLEHGERVHEGLGHVLAAELAVAAVLVGALDIGHLGLVGHDGLHRGGHRLAGARGEGRLELGIRAQEGGALELGSGGRLRAGGMGLARDGGHAGESKGGLHRC